MKKLLATTALVATLAAPVFAQTAPSDAGTESISATVGDTTAKLTITSPYLEGVDAGVLASDLLGKTIYVSGQDLASIPRDAIAEANVDWENAGEISDLVVSLNGDTEAVLVDFGGFLGIGQKTLALSMDSLVMIPDSSATDDYFVVFHGTRAELEAAPEFDRDMVFSADPAVVKDGAATHGSADGILDNGAITNVATNDGLMPAASDGMAQVQADSDTILAEPDVTADASELDQNWGERDMVGKSVYSTTNERVGEISNVVIDNSGRVVAAVIDVGGFLGIGEHRVEVTPASLSLVQDENGESVFRVAFDREYIENLPAHKG